MQPHPFEPFGLPHWVALISTVGAGVFMVRLNRASSVDQRQKHLANCALAVILVTAVILDPVFAWWRQRDNPEAALALIRDSALPLYLCDVVSLILAYALIRRQQRWAELGYLWGMAGTVQALITPALPFSWDSPEYYAFFAQHGGVPVAALTLVMATPLKPMRGAFRRAVVWSWVYMAVVICLNQLLGTNYGFLNGKPEFRSLFDYMGPYPWYLLTLQIVAFTLYLLLLLPFRPWRLRPMAG